MFSLLNTNSTDIFTESLASKSVVVKRKNAGAWNQALLASKLGFVTY